MNLLAEIYSGGNKLKRLLGDFVSDPIGNIQQAVGHANDRAGNLNRLTSLAAQEHVNSIKTGAPMGQAQNKLAQLMADAYNPMGMVVWHGSPHKFSKFDSSKIGTGEGNQAYGHGLYLAENKNVASGYKEMLSDQVFKVDGVPVAPNSDWAIVGTELQSQGPGFVKAKFLSEAEKAAELAKKLPHSTKLKQTAENFKRWASMVDEVDSKAFSIENNGSLYKVDLPDDAIAKMLDWDKPLSQQAPEVKSVLSKVARMDATGEQAWKAAVRESGNPFSPIVEQRGALFDTPEAAAKNLQRLGIPGIRYLDGGSRGAGGGTSNFVVFPGNEGLLNILERNGQPIK